jgi:sugar phosphate isomerase/epimerase
MKRLHICDNDDFDNAIDFILDKQTGIELQSYWNPLIIDEYPQKIDEQLKRIEKIEFRSFHGPFGDLNAGSFDTMIRDVTRNRFEIGYKTAKQLGATELILHHGYVPGTSPIKSWIPRFAQFWKDFLIGKGEMRFHLENMLEFAPDVIYESIEAIGRENVDCCLDIGHTHCDSRTSAEEWIKKLGNKIGYVHIHDNDGTCDAHTAIGKGNIPFIKVLAKLNEYSPNAIWSIETNVNNISETYEWMQKNKFI